LQTIPLAAFQIPYFQCQGEFAPCVASCLPSGPSQTGDTLNTEECAQACNQRFQCGTTIGSQTLQVDADGNRLDGFTKKDTVKNLSAQRVKAAQASTSGSSRLNGIAAAIVFIVLSVISSNL